MLFKSKKDKKNVVDFNKIVEPDSYFGKNSVLIMTITFIVIISLLLINTFTMRNKIIDDVRKYIDDVSEETISNVSYVLNENLLFVEELADSFSKLQKADINYEELTNRANHWGLDELGIIVRNGADIYDSFCNRMMELVVKQPQMYDEGMISCINNHKIVYSAPLKIDGENDMVLIGAKNYESVVEILETTDFKGVGLSVIADGEGNVLFSPKDDSFTLNLDGSALASTIAENNGIVEMTTSDNSIVLANIKNLNINDWKVVTFIPQSLLINTSLAPLVNYIIIIIMSAVVFLCLIVYITKSKRALINQLKEYSFVDSMTGGLNDLAFQYKSKQLLLDAKSNEYAMVYLNVINFKQINERWGMKRGNDVLKYIYQTVDKFLDSDECVARCELDHYFILMKNTGNSDDLTQRLDLLFKKINSFGLDISSQENVYGIDISAGIYLISNNEEDVKTCQSKARRSSSVGRDKQVFTFYDKKLVTRELYLKKLNDMFQEGINNQQFEVFLQPKVSLKDQNIEAEALVRWNNPTLGMITPGDFIPIFEQNGKICELDVYVFKKVCELLASYRAKGKDMFRVSVNLSRAHLTTLGMYYINKMIDIKNHYNIPDGILELEMTESIMIDNDRLPFVTEMIDIVHSHGMQCSLDDFGFGYSSLSILRSLDIDTIKLDRNFFLEKTAKSWYIVESFVKMAHGLNIKIVAEGIEYADQVASLQRCGCDMIQGYYFSKPMPVDEFVTWYEERVNRR